MARVSSRGKLRFLRVQNDEFSASMGSIVCVSMFALARAGPAIQASVRAHQPCVVADDGAKLVGSD